MNTNQNSSPIQNPTSDAPNNPKLSIKQRRDIKWAAHKDEIEHLYIQQNLPLKETMRRIRERHGFGASQRTWKTKLCEWKFEKNLHSQNMATLVNIGEKRLREEGKETIFYHGSLQMRPERFENFKKRKVANEANQTYSSIGTPENVTYHTPKPERDTEPDQVVRAFEIPESVLPRIGEINTMSDLSMENLTLVDNTIEQEGLSKSSMQIRPLPAFNENHGSPGLIVRDFFRAQTAISRPLKSQTEVEKYIRAAEHNNEPLLEHFQRVVVIFRNAEKFFTQELLEKTGSRLEPFIEALYRDMVNRKPMEVESPGGLLCDDQISTLLLVASRIWDKSSTAMIQICRIVGLFWEKMMDKPLFSKFFFLEADIEEAIKAERYDRVFELQLLLVQNLLQLSCFDKAFTLFGQSVAHFCSCHMGNWLVGSKVYLLSDAFWSQCRQENNQNLEALTSLMLKVVRKKMEIEHAQPRSHFLDFYLLILDIASTVGFIVIPGSWAWNPAVDRILTVIMPKLDNLAADLTTTCIKAVGYLSRCISRSKQNDKSVWLLCFDDINRACELSQLAIKYAMVRDLSMVSDLIQWFQRAEVNLTRNQQFRDEILKFEPHSGIFTLLTSERERLQRWKNFAVEIHDLPLSTIPEELENLEAISTSSSSIIELPVEKRFHFPLRYEIVDLDDISNIGKLPSHKSSTIISSSIPSHRYGLTYSDGSNISVMDFDYSDLFS